MGNNDSKQKKPARRVELHVAKDLAQKLHVKSESDTLSHDLFFQNIGWSDQMCPITNLAWHSIHTSRNPTFGDVLDFLDGMVFQDPSYSAKYLSRMLGEPLKESASKYARDLIRLFNGIQTTARTSWSSIGIFSSEDVTAALSVYLVNSFENLQAVNNIEVIQSWLQKVPLIFEIQRSVFRHLFNLQSNLVPDLLPMLTSQISLKSSPSVLDTNDILLLNNSLPHDLQSEWNLLFSTRIHGLSFSSMLAKVMNRGPTIIIVEDTKGHVFGGFASESWRIFPKYIGDGRCFLFQTRPVISLHTSTGYNNNYMYLNHQQQTMPNGLGMGGQLGHFGIWIDADFGKGHSSEGCSTFSHVPTLSADKEFVIDHMEVWAVGPPPKDDSDEETDNKRSILDKDNAAKALLELVDRGRHSDGLREEPDEN